MLNIAKKSWRIFHESRAMHNSTTLLLETVGEISVIHNSTSLLLQTVGETIPHRTRFKRLSPLLSSTWCCRTNVSHRSIHRFGRIPFMDSPVYLTK